MKKRLLALLLILARDDRPVDFQRLVLCEIHNR